MIAPDAGSEGVPIESSSSAMRAVVAMLGRVACHDVPVLLRGESGSGKSALARALHAASPRRDRLLVPVDCRELEADGPRNARVLAEKIGEAMGGSVLLEEVGALPERLQAGVVSLLEPSGARRSGDVRVVATSHLDLEAAVRAGRLREDLVRRLAVVEIRVPPLRERKDDILPLARSFLAAFGRGRVAGLAPRAEVALLSYPWPGNIRELRNAMQRALVLSPGAILDLEALPPKLRASGAEP